MRKITIFLLALVHNLYSHGVGGYEMSGESDFLYHWGGFADFQYREEDLYSRGFSGTYNYENHGEADKIELQHLALYFHSIIENSYIFGIDLNRHNGSGDTLDELIERLFIGYKYHNFKIRAGRIEYALSSVDNDIWGYGFSQMPLSLLSNISYFQGDGVSIKIGNRLYLSGDYSRDANFKTLSWSSKVGYKFHINSIDLEAFSYIHKSESYSRKYDQSLTQHNHSHGEDECSGLAGGEVCIDRDSSILGFGLKGEFQNIKFRSEFIKSRESGDVKDNNYIADSSTGINSLYSQIIYSPIDHLSLGLRYESLNFKHTFSGDGSGALADKLSPEDISQEELITFMVGYKLHKYSQFRVEYENLKSESSIRVQYMFQI